MEMNLSVVALGHYEPLMRIPNVHVHSRQLFRPTINSMSCYRDNKTISNQHLKCHQPLESPSVAISAASAAVDPC